MTESMKERNTRYLMAFYFGHASYKGKIENRYADGLFYMESSDGYFVLERLIKNAKKAAGLKETPHAVFADCCRELDRSLPVESDLSTDSDEEFADGWFYSTQRRCPVGDTRHFAIVLAYCLLKKPALLEHLYPYVKRLVSQLTFFRQECSFAKDLPEMKLFPPSAGCEVQMPMSQAQFQNYKKLEVKLSFLFRHLCRLTGKSLRAATPHPESFVPDEFVSHVEKTISAVKTIVNLLDEKRELLMGSSWFRQLELVESCHSLDRVVTELQKMEQQDWPVSGQDVPEQHPITPEIQDSLLRCFERKVKDEFDPGSSDDEEDGGDDETKDEFDFGSSEDEEDGADDDHDDSSNSSDALKRPGVWHAAELWTLLCRFFKEYDGKLFETEGGSQMKATHAIYVPGAEIQRAADSELEELRVKIKQLCKKVFKVDYRVFLNPGSLWIIIRSAEKLQHLKKFMRNLAEWVEQMRGEALATWRKAEAPLLVPLHTAPSGLLRLVKQVETSLPLRISLRLASYDSMEEPHWMTIVETVPEQPRRIALRLENPCGCVLRRSRRLHRSA